MYCPKCGWDKFSVISVYRDKARKNGKWIFSQGDTRLIICDNCGARYYTYTEITSEVCYNESAGRKYEKPVNKTFARDGELFE